IAPRKFVFLVSESAPPACAQETLVAEQTARKREELNALYVALTRARHTLVISSIEPHRATTDSWWQRLRAQMPPQDETAEAPAPAPAAKTVCSLGLIVGGVQAGGLSHGGAAQPSGVVNAASAQSAPMALIAPMAAVMPATVSADVFHLPELPAWRAPAAPAPEGDGVDADGQASTPADADPA
ncbi:MAG: hypothetical protein NTZ64_17915, partial [Polaromonas sp.]|nr:hypothetical protein [Polaromonas sp.]